MRLSNHCVLFYHKCVDISNILENGGKNISFTIEDQDVYLKYNEIWNKTKNVLNIKFHNEPIYDDKYIKTKGKNIQQYD